MSNLDPDSAMVGCGGRRETPGEPAAEVLPASQLARSTPTFCPTLTLELTRSQVLTTAVRDTV